MKQSGFVKRNLFPQFLSARLKESKAGSNEIGDKRGYDRSGLAGLGCEVDAIISETLSIHSSDILN